jgi:hypothetical protein
MIIQGIKLTGTTVITPNDPTPVLYYDPSNISSYSGSGTTINDLSGNGLTGTMSNITYTSPYFSYNGTSSRITVADNALLEPGTGNWTMEAWINNSGFVGVSRGIISKTNAGGGTTAYRMIVSDTTVIGIMGDNAVTSDIISVSLVATWTHVVHVFTNGSSLETFINGVSVNSVSCGTITVPNTTAPLYLGAETSAGSRWFNGRIGIVRLYNIALSSANVLTNYNGSKAIYGL